MHPFCIVDLLVAVTSVKLLSVTMKHKNRFTLRGCQATKYFLQLSAV